MQKEEANYNMIDWWKKVVLNNYANFNGRARRAEYWYFTLANLVILIPLYIIMFVGIANGSSGISNIGFLLVVLFALGIFVPSLAVIVRRLHDIDKSGWFYFIGLIPLIGSIILLVWFFTDGDRRTNNYGEDPKNPSPQFDFEQPGVTS